MRNRNEFVQLIDRYRLGQAQRLSIGLTIEPDFRLIRTSLVLAEGRGKFLRVRWIENREMAVPESIAVSCAKAAVGEDQGIREFAQLRIDLTRTMATAVNQLATLSGVHSKMLMVVCVDEPGIWIKDYDGKRTWQPFCEPEQLAELGGLTIVDALPGRDLASGGRGWPLSPLPHWLLFADRNRTVAEKPRLLIDLGEFIELTWLPESDGLDDDLPAVRYSRELGAEFEKRLIDACGRLDVSAAMRDDLGAQGKVNTALAGLWSDFVTHHDFSRKSPHDSETRELVEQSARLIRNEGLSVGDFLLTFARHTTMAIKTFVSKRSSRHNFQLIVGGELDRHGLLLSEINQTVDGTWLDTGGINYDPNFLRSATAAIMGLMHVDQMPVTIPWINGSDRPRVLGRLTPGSPGNWRRVIMEMGDCRPPVMKLREAV